MRVVISFSDEEMERLQQYAQNSGLLISTYIKYCAMEGRVVESNPRKVTIPECIEIIQKNLDAEKM